MPGVTGHTGCHDIGTRARRRKVAPALVGSRPAGDHAVQAVPQLPVLLCASVSVIYLRGLWHLSPTHVQGLQQLPDIVIHNCQQHVTEHVTNSEPNSDPKVTSVACVVTIDCRLTSLCYTGVCCRINNSSYGSSIRQPSHPLQVISDTRTVE